MNKRISAVILIILGLALVVFALFYPFDGGEEQDAIDIPLPDQISGLTLSDIVTGEQALDEISFMHRKEFELATGIRGTYGGTEQVTIWVAGTNTDSDAVNLVDLMYDKIAEGSSPFQSSGENLDGERVVYELTGMGQAHFYFRSRKLVIWLAADEDLAGDALEEVLGFYP